MRGAGGPRRCVVERLAMAAGGAVPQIGRGTRGWSDPGPRARLWVWTRRRPTDGLLSAGAGLGRSGPFRHVGRRCLARGRADGHTAAVAMSGRRLGFLGLWELDRYRFELGIHAVVLLATAQPPSRRSVRGAAVFARRLARHLIDHHLAPGQSALMYGHVPYFTHSRLPNTRTNRHWRCRQLTA